MSAKVFCKESECMSATLSSSLMSYVKLMKHVTACEQKLKKFFNISSQQSVYYYIATGNILLCIYIFMMPTTYFHSSRSAMDDAVIYQQPRPLPFLLAGPPLGGIHSSRTMMTKIQLIQQTQILSLSHC